MAKRQKAIIYARVSTKDQEETGYSLPAQEKLLKEYTARSDNNFTIVKKYSLSESASNQQHRKSIDEMIQYARKNDIKILIFEKVDRVTRNLHDSLKIQDWLDEDPERQLHCVKDSIVLHKNSRSQEKLNWDIRVAIARNYSENLSEEVRKGYEEKLRNGLYPSAPKLGYLSEGEGRDRMIVIDSHKGPLLRRVLVEYSQGGYSIRTITDLANTIGLRNTKDRKISRTRMHRYLSDPFYCGSFLWNGKEYKGTHEPLISRSTHKTIKQILTQKAPPIYRKHNYLLKGLVECADCGSMVSWYRQKDYVYGQCNGRTKGKHDGEINKCARQDLFEDEMVGILESLTVPDKAMRDRIRTNLQRESSDRSESSIAQKGAIDERLIQIEKTLKILYDDRLNEVISIDEYQNRSTELQGEQESLQERLEGLSDSTSDHRDIGMAIFDLSQMGIEVWKHATTREKQKMLRLILADLRFNNGNIDYKINPAFKFLMAKVSETNKILESSNYAKTSEKNSKKFEQRTKATKIKETERNQRVDSVWRGGRGSNPRPTQ